MASHDFCHGCEKCDREYYNDSISIKISKLKNVIGEIRELEQKKITPKAKETLQATITMFQIEIDNLAKKYKEYPQREKR